MKKKLKSIFISALIVVIALGIIYKIIVFIINVIQSIKLLLQKWFSQNFPGLEILVAITVIFIIGLLINLTKRKIWEKTEKIPGTKTVKPVQTNTEKLLKQGKIVKIPLFGPISVIGFTDENYLEENGEKDEHKKEVLVFAPTVQCFLPAGWFWCQKIKSNLFAEVFRNSSLCWSAVRII